MHKTKRILATLLAGSIGLLTVAPAFADAMDGGGLVSGPWQSTSFQNTRSGLLLAQVGTPDAGSGKPRSRPAAEGTQAEEAPWYGRNNMHKYLGLGSLALAGLSVLAPKEKGGAHEQLANGAAALGGAAIATGFYAHGDDIDYTWSDPDTRHAVYGILGTLGYLIAVSRGGEGGHAAAGALGAVSMVAAIKIIW
jgi:hypothetical protein